MFGPGAVGGYAGALLARAGHDVSFVGRGEHFAAMRANGVRIRRDADEFVAHPACPDSPEAAGPQDVVLIATKAHAIGEVAALIQPLLGADTAVVTAQNGIPWWYFQRLGGAWDGRRLASVDPGGQALALIGVERAVGCVVTGAFAVESPGVIRAGALARYAIGEPAEGISPRLASLSRAFTVEGLEAPARARFRDDIWSKLLGNASISMICVLTGGTNGTTVNDPGTMRVVRAIMAETRAVSEAIGARFLTDAEDRLLAALRTSTHRPSALQDLERKRPMEVDAIIGAVCEIGRVVGVPTACADMIYALVRLRAEVAGCYPANPGFALGTVI